MDSVILSIVGLAVLGILAAAVIVLAKRPGVGGDISTPLQNLTQAVQQGQAQSAVIAEKLSRLEQVTETASKIQTEVRVISERVAKVEQNQSIAGQSLSALGVGLAETGTVAKGIVDATTAIREELARAKNDLTEIQTQAKSRRDMETRTAESIRRLEAIIAGTQSKGAAGENIVEVVFAKLPPEWQVRNFRVGDKAVEFGIRLPNNLVLPIDSKWAATNLLEQFLEATDPTEQLKLKSQIESVVMSKSREVRKYIEPNITVNFAIATVPDAIYDLCCGIQADIFQQNVVLVSYSMLVPYLLLVFQTVLRSSQNIDLHRLEACLDGVEKGIRSVQEELEGRFSRGLTMLGNARDDMSSHLSKASNGITSLRLQSRPSIETSEMPPLELAMEEK